MRKLMEGLDTLLLACGALFIVFVLAMVCSLTLIKVIYWCIPK